MDTPTVGQPHLYTSVTLPLTDIFCHLLDDKIYPKLFKKTCQKSSKMKVRQTTTNSFDR